jgi:two-component system, LytTR family, sensor histidine kinase AlgZ
MAMSINQNGYRAALPNFGNLGVLLRILVIVNAIVLLAVVIKASSLGAIGAELLETF